MSHKVAVGFHLDSVLKYLVSDKFMNVKITTQENFYFQGIISFLK
jgi:hypothetical protein